MKIGYARVSTGDQNLDLQMDALNKIECDKIFTDKMSGARSDRPGLKEAMKFMRDGDTLIVWRLDRLGRSLQHLIKVINAPFYLSDLNFFNNSLNSSDWMDKSIAFTFSEIFSD